MGSAAPGTCYRDCLGQMLRWLAAHKPDLRALDDYDQQVRRLGQPTVITTVLHQARQARDQAWARFTSRAVTRLCALTARAATGAESLVHLRATQAAYLRAGLLLTLDPAALPGLDPVLGRPVLTRRVAARLRGCCTPTRTAAAALTLATGASAASLTRLSVGDVAQDASTVCLDGLVVELPAYARSLVRALLVERATTLPHQPLFVYASGQYAGRPLQAAALARDLARIAQHAAVTLPGQHPNAAPEVWLRRHGLTLTRLPMAPPTPAQLTTGRL